MVHGDMSKESRAAEPTASWPIWSPKPPRLCVSVGDLTPAHLHRCRPRALTRRQGWCIPERRVRAPGLQAWKAHPNRTLSTPGGSAARRDAETQRLEVEDLQASQARWRPCRWIHATTRGCSGSDLMAPRLRVSARDSSPSPFTESREVASMANVQRAHAGQEPL
jgi:hypothetical protein